MTYRRLEEALQSNGARHREDFRPARFLALMLWSVLSLFTQFCDQLSVYRLLVPATF